MEAKLNRIHPIYVLWLIREERVQSVEDLRSHFSWAFETTRYSREANKILAILNDLITAGLVSRNRNSLSSTSLTERMQAALDISLADLLSYGPNSIAVNPIFGKPRSNNSSTDVFVLMPFSDDLRPVYDDHLKTVITLLDLTVARADDDFFAPHPIISDIWDAIYNSRIIVADCTGRNPNVFYEIGIAHTIGRPTILISQTIDDVPFDLRHLRCIIYEYTPRGMVKFHETLRRTLELEKQKLPEVESEPTV
jgi:hypothetical protein